MLLRPLDPSFMAAWDAFVARSTCGTFLHTRRYLAHQKGRFKDASYLVEGGPQGPAGLFPAAVDPARPATISSHPGLSYGGVLHSGGLTGDRMLATLEALCAQYARDGFRSLHYKPVPHFYHRVPSEDDIYALSRLGAKQITCDLNSVVDLAARPAPAARRRRGLRRARRAGIRVLEGAEHTPPFWRILEQNLSDRHGVRPVHTSDEMLELQRSFPSGVSTVVGLLADDLVAGVVLFRTGRVVHTQYIGSNDRGREVSALDVVLEHCIGEAARGGARFFSFGVSTERGGAELNDGLYQFKTEFGAGGVVHAAYSVDL